MRTIAALALFACHHPAAVVANEEPATPCVAIRYPTGEVGATRLVVRGDRLYALVGDSILVYPLDGGTPTTLVTMHDLADMIVDGDQLVYSQHESGVLYRVPLVGGAPVAIGGGLDRPRSIAPLAGGAYAVGALTGLYRVARDGRVTKVLDGESAFATFARNGVAYAATYDSIVALGATGPVKRVFASAEGTVGILAGDDRGIYFSGPDVDVDDEVSRYDLASGAVTRVGGVDGPPIALAIAGADVYAATLDEIVRVRDGAVMKTGSLVSALAADGPSLYYSTSGGAIARTCFTGAARRAPP